MASVEDYLSAKQQELGRRYRADCGEIAKQVAELLKSTGEDPYLIALHGTLKNPNTNSRWPLIPAAYSNQLRPVKFDGHYVCAASEITYDPIIGYPLPVEEYLDRAFTVRPALVERLTFGEAYL